MRFTQIQLPSNRRFGLFFTFVFLGICVYFYWMQEVWVGTIFFVSAIVFALVTFINDKLLLPLNKLWMGLGFVLSMIISPIVLAILFFGLFTPIAIFMRLFGRDELQLKKLKAKSFWRLRALSQPESESFRYQF